MVESDEVNVIQYWNTKRMALAFNMIRYTIMRKHSCKKAGVKAYKQGKACPAKRKMSKRDKRPNKGNNKSAESQEKTSFYDTKSKLDREDSELLEEMNRRTKEERKNHQVGDIFSV